MSKNVRKKKVITNKPSYYRFKDSIPIMKRKRVQRTNRETILHKIEKGPL